MALLILRIGFILVASGLGVWLIQQRVEPLDLSFRDNPWATWIGVILVALLVIWADMAAHRKRLDTISAVYFGLIVGLFLTYVAGLALTPLPITEQTRVGLQLIIGMALCYFSVSLLLQTRNDFRFIIPYVEFSKDVKGLKPYILDTSVIIDGRIADIVDTKVLDSQLIVPRFVLTELQSVADSSDRLRRSRGRRGLDILNRLRSKENVDLQIYEHDLPELDNQPVDMKLVLLAKHVDGKIITNDYNLNKVARLHDVGVINLNDIANSLKPIFLPGETIELQMIKAGEEAGQGVGYLDDGTMVVVEQGRDHVGEPIKITVTSVLQTSAGRMIFGRFEGATQT